LACWNAACLFWPIITNVDRKIASSDTQGIELRRTGKTLHSVTPEAHQAA
jgi:hypothetical protein